MIGDIRIMFANGSWRVVQTDYPVNRILKKGTKLECINFLKYEWNKK